MTKITIKAQRLDPEFEHDTKYEWVLTSADDLRGFRRMQIPPEHYSHVYVTVNLSDITTMAFVTNPLSIGKNVFNRVKDFVFGSFVHELFR